MNYKENMLCSKTHEYIVKDGEEYVVGLTDFAIDQLGDIVFLELPETNSEFNKNEVFANIESVKAASEIYLPVSGRIIEINEALIDSPEMLNEDCYENGWLVKLELTGNESEFEDLMTYNDYKEEVE